MTQIQARNFKTAVIPLVILMVGVEAVSKFGLLGLSLRFDESQSILQARFSPLHIINYVAQDVHIPLYDLILHYWMLVCGFTVASGRAFSLIVFLLSIPVIYIFARQTLDSTAALFAAAMFALSPFMNWYGNEMRMYTLLTLVVMLNQYFFICIFRHKGGLSWLGYFVTALIGIFIHYFFLLVPLTQIVFFVACHRLFPPKAIQRFAVIGLVLAAIFGLWLRYVIVVQHLFSANRLSSWAPVLPPVTTIDVFNVFSQFLFGFQSDHVNTILVSAWPLCILLGLLAVRRNVKVPSEIIYLLISILIPLGIIFILSITLRPMFLSRYFIYTLPSLCIFIAWLISACPPLLAGMMKTGIIAAMATALFVEIVSPATPVKEDYRSAVQYMDANADSRDIIIVSAPFTVYPVEFYYRGHSAIATMPIWNQSAGGLPAFNQSKLPLEVAQLIANHRRAFLLLSYDQGYERAISAYFDRNFHLESKQHFSPHLDIYVYQVQKVP